MADFWAGYLSGIAGIVVGSPLDIIKTRSQSQVSTSASSWYQSPSSLVRGTAAPILSTGALNALLFYSYNRSLLLLSASTPAGNGDPPLWRIFLSGAFSGIACFVITTPTELIKCRAQITTHQSSFNVAKDLYRAYGSIRGFYLGGVVTALRDSVGYGFYFWAYEGSKRYFPIDRAVYPEGSWMPEINTLLCGGVAGMVGWATVYPLDVVKTMVQVQAVGGHGGRSADSQGLLGPRGESPSSRPRSAMSGIGGEREVGAWECAKKAYKEGGVKVFWNGIWVCLGRAFIVNAVTFLTYEWAMKRLSATGSAGATEYTTESSI